LNVLLACFGRDFLGLIKIGRERREPITSHLRIVVELTQQALAFDLYLPVDLADLRLELLDPRMLIEKRRRLFGELRAHRNSLFDQASHCVGVSDIGGVDRLPGAYLVA
jgi:hypothetical protein